MDRLKLFGEGQPQGGTTNHSALANLGYAESGHTGFVPSQGEALIEILRCTTRASVGSGATPNTTRLLNVVGTLDTHPAAAVHALIYGNRAAGPQFVYGLAGGAVGQSTAAPSFIYGLYFFAQHDSPAACYQIGGIYIQQQSGAAGTGLLSNATGITIPYAYWAGSQPTTTYGIDIADQGGGSVAMAYGLRIIDQNATTVRLLELGPSTPYLRLLGGADPPTDKSNLYLKFGSTLYRVVKSGNHMTLEAA
jgi:hypothetical protein